MSHEAKTDNRPYWQKLRDMKLGKTVSDDQARKDRKDDLTKWYLTQATMAPAFCENCKTSLQSTINFHPRAHICHILPKTNEGGCPSVATHPLNRWFGCKNCHDAFDNESPEVVETMAVIPLCRDRVSKFYSEIAPAEVRRVPYFLVPGTPPREITEENLPVIQVHQKPRKVKPKIVKENASQKDKPKRGAGGKFIPRKS